jgi:DNA-binding Xre family transcriptional regulator
MSNNIKSFSGNTIYKTLLDKVVHSDKSVLDFYEEIKKATGASNKQITYWMKNKGNQPNLGQIAIIAQVLECTIEDLIEYETTKPQSPNSKKTKKVY